VRVAADCVDGYKVNAVDGIGDQLEKVISPTRVSLAAQ
jgi:hypothetical protein